MSEVQLREAFALMKRGEKQSAVSLVQDVLREDRSNLNAWWLLSHLLEDEEKVVKSLEKVLALNPEHPGARKRLAELRPEYAHLTAAPNPEAVKSKAKNKEYWDKLSHAPRKEPMSWNFAAPIIRTFGWSIGGRIVLFIIVIIAVTVMSIANFITDIFTPDNPQAVIDNNPILNSMENTPESVAQAYFEAIYREDVIALVEITCASDQDWLAERMAEFEDPEPENVSVNFSQTSFTLDESDVTWAYVSIHGTTVISERGSSVTINWDERASHEGGGTYGLYLQKINDTWLVCGE